MAAPSSVILPRWARSSSSFVRERITHSETALAPAFPASFLPILSAGKLLAERIKQRSQPGPDHTSRRQQAHTATLRSQNSSQPRRAFSPHLGRRGCPADSSEERSGQRRTIPYASRRIDAVFFRRSAASELASLRESSRAIILQRNLSRVNRGWLQHASARLFDGHGV